MSMHTPGPWVADRVMQLDGRSGSYQQVLDGPVTGMGSNILAWVCVAHPYNHDLQEHGYANARLIAAAPELLQAAEQFLASVKDGNVSELVEYYADIFGDAVKKAGGHLPE